MLQHFFWGTDQEVHLCERWKKCRHAPKRLMAHHLWCMHFERPFISSRKTRSSSRWKAGSFDGPVEDPAMRGSEPEGLALMISEHSMLYGLRLRLRRSPCEIPQRGSRSEEREFNRARIGIRNTVFGKSSRVRRRIKKPQPTDERRNPPQADATE